MSAQARYFYLKKVPKKKLKAYSKNLGNFTYSSISKIILHRKMDEKIIFAFYFAFYPSVLWFKYKVPY